MKFVIDNILLVVTALVSGGLLLWPMVRRGTGGPWVTATQAVQLINKEDALVLDIREAPEYSAAHILNARNIPLKDLAARAKEIEKFKQKPVIVACDSGSRSGAAVTVLKQQGFANVHNLSGGLGAWQQAGLPTEKQ
ncbi:MAG: rhodanese-like domain-containing protein [Burkholderiales bacterium]|nr:rhodanese-like domain-containing protein [Burkholderiales bacterium]